MKYLSKLTLLLAFVAVVVSACKKDEELAQTFDNNVLLTANSGVLAYNDIANAGIQMTVNTFNEGGVDQITIMKSFNGAAAVQHAVVTSFPTTLTIPVADVVNGLGVVPDSLEVGDKVVFTFKVSMNGTEFVSPTKYTATVSCLSNLAGTYSRTTTYGFHDFLPNYSSNTDTVEVTSTASGVYTVSDFSGGLYGVGPYSTAYGTTAEIFTFSDICNTITWTGQSDPYGTMVPNTAAGSVNAYDPVAQTITISWFCNGYGENGVSVYTKIP